MPQEKITLYEHEDEIPEAVKGAHLERPQEQRIKIKLYDSSDPEQYLRFILGGGAGEIFADSTLVNYFDPRENSDRLNTTDEIGYVISPVDETPKRSYSYQNCLGVVAIAEDKTTGKQISFLSHQNPTFVLSTNKEAFEKDLCKAIEILISRAKPGTIDIGVIGGNYYDDYIMFAGKTTTNAEQHKKAIAQLSEIIQKAFKERKNGNQFPAQIVRKTLNQKRSDVPPTVLAGPDYSGSLTGFSETDVVLDTQARIVLEARPKQRYELSNETYPISDGRNFTEEFDKNKYLEWKEPRYNEKVAQLAEETARFIDDPNAQNTDFLPKEERETYLELGELGIPTPSLFTRSRYGKVIFGNEDYKNLMLDDDQRKYKAEKFEEIANFSPFVERLLNDILKIAGAKKQMMSDRFCLSYKYDPNKHTVDYCVGSTERSAGFRYIDNAPDEESALLQNIAVFMKSFHVFLDTYTRREMRNDYMRTLEEMAKNFLRDHIAEERYRSITEAM